ncbi:PRCC domain-containing protein [Aspergillus ruber CBS 135680]|uniref:Mitotic checkpoint regulator, MAD2B-interacting-domain-containing protein n=1 Tax=Aspergillus ruber (strain CBS 135680) TaxID=1388766 RepID=A0A017SL76_ASPRC|nr:uncharacterized protein EURHEDRAFT_409927 [Aspergillus ruber CBS 135680]EYE97692.1 hypothetical protein EURHEDRAFT_409927 [Aspergillus ruber CBS 135680]
MALVNYSDSEASDSEQENITQPQQKKTVSAPALAPTNNPSKQTSGANFSSIVDRSNPRKIRVALPEIKPETTDGDQESEDGPARKKPRLGGGGAFSGFNAMLPAPKRKTVTADKDKKPSGPARKVFGLKTGAAPGFDRSADAEMRHNQALDGDDEDIPKAGSLQGENYIEGGSSETKPPRKPEGEVKLKGNAMMFKPLSVGRNQKKKPPPTPLPAADESKPVPQLKQQQQPAQQAPPPPAPKPKVSLFSISSEDSSATAPSTGPAQSTTYQPLVYNTIPDAPVAGPALESEAITTSEASTATPQQTQTLDNIADDLNLSRAQRRHLFGRHGDTSKSRILNFNTDTEYAANQEMAQGTDLAAAQHNPVRAIAPGKHTLQQLVNAASNQRDALEESFATGRRNKKEAGSKYGW